ncbi:hypothetical protein LEP1GSC079_3655 [Leptospira interrogans str. FPW1039]|uniref:Uncharacterized protein n=1 Tax=Leptospira interrogans str. FPW1039 TaxID=1193040 RepID=A0A0F6IJW3_LEPIR|nr:hypothetical protein LEP1GSC045_1740 [Leptospira interrogans serovar Pomona str. Kennewicki LC82-25]EJP04556.1 hypothetical protein LEP1GSC007_2544 [Leptospira interrogans serovar Bulgarica str. Mallika]EKN99306.1 hypothetical protein LEP1GSC014_0523 [Leptospira interrogans serovar Pomona str. Pomona]EKR34584.1 hypothetical protein LEP1GSC096_3313 [Leptospira interrogans serovar Hebdomadis str. R499]EMF32091.1 hypothetical protein LEP1GSC201_2658 [Leptospira interrogans serovar Pomona str. F
METVDWSSFVKLHYRIFQQFYLFFMKKLGFYKTNSYAELTLLGSFFNE